MVLAVTTRIGGVGAINVYQQYGQAVYLLPYAVLAVPVATAAFPRLARQAADGDRAAFARTSAVATRGVLVASVLGAGMLVAAAPAAQRLFTGLDAVGGPALGSLADGVTALAIGLPGWALVALGGRALYALGRGRAAATATATGWLVVVGASLVAVTLLRAAGQGADRAAVVGLGLGNSAGMCVAGVLLLLALRRAAGTEALAGVLGTFLRTAAAALAAAVAGRLVADVVLRALPRGVVLPPLAAAAAEPRSCSSWWAWPWRPPNRPPWRPCCVAATQLAPIERLSAIKPSWTIRRPCAIMRRSPHPLSLIMHVRRGRRTAQTCTISAKGRGGTCCSCSPPAAAVPDGTSRSWPVGWPVSATG